MFVVRGVTSVVSYLAFVLSYFVPYLSFFWRLGKAALRKCVISCVSLHIGVFFHNCS